MSELLIQFERVGRSRTVPPMRLPADTHPDRVAEAIYREAGKHLGSRDWDVNVRLPQPARLGTFTLGWGRLGKGTITIDEPHGAEDGPAGETTPELADTSEANCG